MYGGVFQAVNEQVITEYWATVGRLETAFRPRTALTIRVFRMGS
jgi:hypothetical protein